MTQRLGYLRGGAEDVLAHPWLKPLDAAALINYCVEAPWKPRLKGARDVQARPPASTGRLARFPCRAPRGGSSPAPTPTSPRAVL